MPEVILLAGAENDSLDIFARLEARDVFGKILVEL